MLLSVYVQEAFVNTLFFSSETGELTNCKQLCRLGFDRDQAIQAYFACDKNEELAANFLFDQPDDEDPPAAQ